MLYNPNTMHTYPCHILQPICYMIKKLLSTLLFICSTGYITIAQTTSKTLDADQLVKIIVDLELTKTLIYHDVEDDEQLAQQLLQEQQALIFEAYAINQVSFQHSYEQFLHTPKKFKQLQEAVITQLEQRLQAVQVD